MTTARSKKEFAELRQKCFEDYDCVRIMLLLYKE